MLVSLTAGAAFVELVDAVTSEEGASSPDAEVARWIAERRTPWVTALMRLTTRLADYAIAGTVAAAAAVALVAARRRGPASALVASSLGAMLVTEVLKEVVGRERPMADGRLVEAAGHAFPSGHSSQAVACYGGLALAVVLTTRSSRRRAAAVAAVAVVALAVGTSRVYLGVHWPADVLSGWIVGLTWLALVASGSLLLQRLDRPRGWWPVERDGSATRCACRRWPGR
ncbi:phosphatase PAP2 family protein [Actinomarinicola tropica]|uniref:Phosphatase PAP2 family protein n=1 Tax=Actinomarinicola tropica TaxID=2789776 RepID=A0A5Q2RF30_9ACTN|nr:phosphatase PAP2 family protein [Actinomarinicola tropica]QGG94283.1 phosphatase PAP2 family protein [Actinomarinicola tropica]